MLAVHNPATGERIAELQTDDDASVARKAAAARRAQAGWAATPLAARQAAIGRFRDALAQQREALAHTLTAEVGKPITQARNEIAGLAPRLDYWLAEAPTALGIETVYADAAITERISREPLGVVANISAWNYPYFVGANVFVPALLAGNAVLYKPSEHAPLTGQHIARLLHAAGVPGDVFATLIGGGEVGAALLAQPIDGVFFTGSHATGARIAQTLGGRYGVKLQLELGGKDPAYVRADADVPAAAASLADGAMYNTGQSCCSVERIYVHERVHDAFVEHFVAAVAAMKAGDPMDEATDVGAITRAPQLDVLDAQVEDARLRGATLRLGGRRRAGPGQFYEPTVFTEATHDMLLMREESFGPIVGIARVTSDDEAVAKMNDTRYGLTAAVYSADGAAAEAVLSRVNAGTMYWNCCDRVSPRLPWSGYGDSGVGLTLSREGLTTFTCPKAWHLRRG